MRQVNTLMRKQSGIALITTLLLLLLMSAMVVGFILLVTEGQRLSGLNNEQSKAFYGAESGMEKLTADLGTLFGTTYAPTGAQVNALMAAPPALAAGSGITYQNAVGANGYLIAFPPDNNGNPKAAFAQVTSGSSAFQGMSALETTYTLTVEARTTTNADVKLTRTTQTVGIPLFQFGVFSDTDLSFYPGPNFDFGGRVHTNGNLFLDSGGPANATPTQTTVNQLWMGSPVTAVRSILRNCRSNGSLESTNGPHPGSVEITKGGGVYQALGFNQGSITGCLGSGANASWPTVSASYNGNLRSGVKPLNLTLTLLGAASPVEMVRRPVLGENAANSGVLGERYFSQASLRVLISDNAADITSLPCVSAGAPFNLADLALPVPAWATPNATALKAAMTAAGTIPLPLAASGAATGAYVQGYVPAVPTGIAGGDGYWQPNATKIITGYIKIDAQTTYGSPCGAYVDVTQEILSLGYAGKNINPVSQSLDGNTLNPMWGNSAAYTANMQLGAAPALPAVPAAQMPGQNSAPMGAGIFTGANGTCKDPHPNAVIRLERIRDNPSSVLFTAGARKTTAPTNLPVQSTVAQVCGVDPATGTPLVLQPSDFWPNTLFDTREGARRDVDPGTGRVTLGGVMNYVELDVRNVARWFSGAIGATGANTRDPNTAPNNFVVYISDRRGNYAAAAAFAGTWPPRSPSGNETGEYGYADFINPLTATGCPNNGLDTGEDVSGTGVLYTYGETSFPNALVDSTGVATAATLFATSLNAVTADPNCPTGGTAGINPWPGAYLFNANEGRENPLPLFRRAVKVVNGNLITLPACPGAVPCGLSIATENPAYIQGDFNANSANNGFNDPDVATSITADALTLLSVSWNDVNSFAFPYNTGKRSGATSWYRIGVNAGKGLSFPIPAWDTAALDGSRDMGTDGGVHNFMRFLEGWNGTLNYQGSLVSMFYNRQATGIYKCCNTVYSPPTRGYSFDVNFLNPALLPPRTPMFRDINTTGFTQLLLANQ
jgi:hypothetical protein